MVAPNWGILLWVLIIWVDLDVSCVCVSSLIVKFEILR